MKKRKELRKVIKISGKDYDLVLDNKNVVLHNIEKFIDKKAPLKVIVDLNDKNAITKFIKQVMKAGKLTKLKSDKLNNLNLSIADMYKILESIPTLTLPINNEKLHIALNVFKFDAFDYKKYYRNKWALFMDKKHKIKHTPLKELKDRKNLAIVFVENIGLCGKERNQRRLGEDFINI